ncbi:type III pantothenate kinase [Coprobacter sp. LH1063]|uniref:Type III pantothenate kinase n=2 Tax=Coprobacter tertius TaxID=2944915 RepID=A0ABT1MHH9_9BACT|nr:type III pantothenate kinase [Coprobacter tertius]
MANLIIDQGNTTLKLAVFDKNEPVAFTQLRKWDEGIVSGLLEDYSIEACIYASVAAPSEKEIIWLGDNIERFIEFNHKTLLPINIDYRTPDTLGLDRIAGVVGAFYEKKGHDILVIDAGTAITYDVLTADGRFIGGNISPGIKMRLKSLHAFTGRLPMVPKEGDIPAIGYDTDTAIRSGVMEGIRFEMEGYIEEVKSKCPEVLIFLTGGDAFLFAERVKSTIFADKNIVLKGLNRILDYNVK